MLRPLLRGAPPALRGGASRWALSGDQRDAERGRELAEWASAEDVDLISEGFLPGDFFFHCPRPVLVSEAPRPGGAGAPAAEFRIAFTFRGAEAVLPELLAARTLPGASERSRAPTSGEVRGVCGPGAPVRRVAPPALSLGLPPLPGEEEEAADVPHRLPFYLRELLGRRCEVSLSVPLGEWPAAGPRGALLAALHRELFALLPVGHLLEGAVEVAGPFPGLPFPLALPGDHLVGALADCAQALAEPRPSMGRARGSVMADVCYIDYLERDSWYYVGEHRLLSKGTRPDADVPASPSVIYASVCDALLFGRAGGGAAGGGLWALDKMRGARVLVAGASRELSPRWEFDLSQAGEQCPLAGFLRAAGAPLCSGGDDLRVTPTPVLSQGPGSDAGSGRGERADRHGGSPDGRAPLQPVAVNALPPAAERHRKEKRARLLGRPGVRPKARRGTRTTRQRLMREAEQAPGSCGDEPWEPRQVGGEEEEALRRKAAVTRPEPSDPVLRSFLSGLPSIVTSAAHLVLLGSGSSGRGTSSDEAPSVKPEEAAALRRARASRPAPRRIRSPSSTESAECGPETGAGAGAAGPHKPTVFVRRGKKRPREAATEARAKKKGRWTQPAPPGRRTGRHNAGQGRGWRDSWWKA